MKKILLILIVIGGGYYYFQGSNQENLSIKDLISNSSDSESQIVKVTGVVKTNFKLIYSIYELKDTNSLESIMVSTNGNLPKIGETISVKLKKKDVLTLNDKTFSLYEEIN
jgi:hypothetical protein